MDRCAHGVYLPAWVTDGNNPFCSGCEAFGRVPNPQEVVLPARSNGALNTTEFAGGTGCPACGSAVYMRVKETGGDSHRECAECGKQYRVRMSEHQRAVRVKEAECAE
jgi:Zn ribbon nucleic-acid-binding protein